MKSYSEGVESIRGLVDATPLELMMV